MEYMINAIAMIIPITQPISFLFEKIGFTSSLLLFLFFNGLYFFINDGFAKIAPVPSATQSSGSLATKAGTCVSFEIISAR